MDLIKTFILSLSITVMLSILLPEQVEGQSHNYWTRSFNEETSLLSGAVVGGGAGSAAIYFNPAGIAENTESSLSVNASLFSFKFLKVENALGDGIDLNYSRGIIEPRFISYNIKPKNHPGLNLEIAFLNNENYSLEFTHSLENEIDVLKNLEGDERYYSFFNYTNNYRDDWIGIGVPLKLSPKLFLGTSMFLSIRSLDYRYVTDTEAFPLDSAFSGSQQEPFYSANYQDYEYLGFNDYRLLWKFGLLYKSERISFGINLTTPSVGHIYSDGKKVSRKTKQSNITSPETGEPLPDYTLVDYKEAKDVSVNDKSPLSVSAGITYLFPEKKMTLYSTFEYFAGIDTYRLVEADESADLAAGLPIQDFEFNEWLTFVSGAKPVLNGALGFRWCINQDLMFLSGFRTDFNYRKNLEYSPFASRKKINGVDLDVYHVTSGLSLKIKGQYLIVGIQYSAGRNKNKEQFINLSDPSEFNTTELAPLQGTRQNNVNSTLNAFSIYFGATFNFGGKEKSK